MLVKDLRLGQQVDTVSTALPRMQEPVYRNQDLEDVPGLNPSETVSGIVIDEPDAAASRFDNLNRTSTAFYFDYTERSRALKSMR